MLVGILTGGGDCPGLNAVIRAVTRCCQIEGYGVMGIQNGWRGLLNCEASPLTMRSIRGILPLGGTILGTSRTNPFSQHNGPTRVLDGLRELAIDALVVIGGEDTLGVAQRFHEEHGVKVVGVPKTIDNDLSGTDYTFGFDTAVTIACEAIDRLHTTAESHNRGMVVEVMGRHAGWIAIHSGIAGGADAILIPEFPLTVEEVSALVRQRADRGKTFSIIVVAEGAKLHWRSGESETVVASEEMDAFGHVRLGGVGTVLAKEIERLTGVETRVTILGYVQRGGTPTPRDRVLATRFGVHAAKMITQGQWGMMAALRGTAIEAIPIGEAVGQYKLVPRDLYDVARAFFG
jgi:phosphofructokinase-like protein